MGRFLIPAMVLLAIGLSGHMAQAQQPLPAASCDSISLQAPPCVCPPPPPPAAIPYLPPATAFEREPLFAVELLLGQESGIRAQVSVYSDNHEVLVAEGFYGGLFTDLGSSQALGTGARYLLSSGWLAGPDSLVFGTGVDVFFELNHRALFLLDPSVNLAWMLKLGPSLAFELGLEAGLGIGLAGHTDHGHAAAGDLTPLVSFYTGLRF